MAERPNRFAPVFKSIFLRDKGRFTQLDGLRALAILWTFSFHVVLLFANFVPRTEALALFGQPAVQVFMQGHFGVDIFFVISGFLIGDLLIREVEKTGTLNLRTFFVRRMVRLAPVYYLLIALVVVLGLVTGDPSVHVENAWTNLIYVNNFVPDFEQFMQWTWSLAVEEQFYLLCPLLILLMHRKGLNPFVILAGLIAAGFAINILIARASGEPFYFVIHPVLTDNKAEMARYLDLLYTKLHARYGALLMGVLLAYAVRRPALIAAIAPGGSALALGGAGLAMVAAVLASLDYMTPDVPVSGLFMATHRYWFAVGATLLLLVTFSTSAIGRALHRLLSLPVWYPLAQLSYSAYLVHPLVIFGLIRGWYHGQPVTPGDVAMIGAMSGALTLAIAFLLTAIVEKPLMALRPR